MLSVRERPVFAAPPSTTSSNSSLSSASRRINFNPSRFLSFSWATTPFATTPTPTPPPELRIVPVRGDGRCLYRAIAKNLASTDGRRLSEDLERADADYLRKVAWKTICYDRSKEFEAKHVIEGSLKAYCAQMRNPTFYAGEAEMLALTDVLKRPIQVYLRSSRGELRNIQTYGQQYAAIKTPKGRRKVTKIVPAIRVLYTNGNHYDALLVR